MKESSKRWARQEHYCKTSYSRLYQDSREEMHVQVTKAIRRITNSHAAQWRRLHTITVNGEPALSDRQASRYHGRYWADSGHRRAGPEMTLLTDTVAKVESCRATNFSRNYETGSNRRFV
jgi:hypothetical protein